VNAVKLLIKAILSYRYFLSLKNNQIIQIRKHRMNWEQLLSLKDKATQASDYVLNKMILVWVLK
jgi:hypothetical protein